MSADACPAIGDMAKESLTEEICLSITWKNSNSSKYVYIVSYRLKMLEHVRPKVCSPSQIFAIRCLRFKRSVYSNRTVSVLGLLKLLSHFHTSDQRDSLVYIDKLFRFRDTTKCTSVYS